MQIRIFVIVLICLLNCLGVTHAQNFKPLDLINAQKKLLVPSNFNPFTLNDSRNVVSLPSDIQNPILLNLNKTTLKDLLASNAGLISISIPSSDRNTLTLNLTPVDVMEKGGKVMLAPSGEEAKLTQGKHYRGVISGDDKSLVAISVFDDEIMGFIAGEQITGNLVLGRLENSDVHILYQDEEINHHFHFECGTADSGEIYTRDQLNGPEEGSRSLSDCVRLYLEVDFDIYTGKGSSVTATTNYITGVFNQVSTLYANENLNTIVSEIVIWTQNSPYNGTTSLAMLNAFTAHRQGFNGDLAQLLSYKASGGVAYLDGLCRANPDFSMSFSSIHSTYQNVPTYSWTVEVCAHEFGHLFGSQHTHACAWNGNGTAIDGCYAPEGGCPNPGLPQGGGTVMSYCHLTNVGINFANGFGTQPGNIMRSKVTNANCLQTCEGGGNECTDNEVVLTIRVDNYPSETTWNLKNSSNVIIYSGGPYTGAGSTKIENFCLTDGCYTFTIFDSYGDGICCNYGQGFYHVKKGTTTLAEGGQFGSSQIHNFCVTNSNQPSCTDGIQNGQETGIDCGGPTCPACPTCSDGIQNGQETGVDCGGPACPSCPTCSDGIQNGQETGVDCGGPSCPACPTCNDGIQNGQETGVDCGGPTCPACPTCNDGIQNGNETGIDCGGNCPPCNTINLSGHYFETGWDGWQSGGSNAVRYTGSLSPEGNSSIRIASNSPTTSIFTSPLYNLTPYNTITIEFMFRATSMETGEDFWLRYFNGTSWTTIAQYVSGTDFNNNIVYTKTVTINGPFPSNARFRFHNDAGDTSDRVYIDAVRITATTSGNQPTCNDGIQNGQETGVDCGGPTCPACPTCNDGIQNGQETGVDCGGPSCPSCPTCNDGIQNGQETGVDCGGPTCPACPTCNDGIQNGNETGIDCGGNCPPCNTINLSGHYFETGWDGWQSGGSNAVRYTGSLSPEGNSSIRIASNSPTTSIFTSPLYNLTAYNTITIEFMFRATSMETGEDFWLRYFNGTSWTTIAQYVSGTDFNNNIVYTRTVTINGPFPSNARFRFHNDAGDTSDRVYIDAVRITATTSGNQPTCNDGIQNGQETGIDCGGPTCPACPTCNDGIQNGQETGVDCGGPSCPSCPTCNDGIQNGQETGVDCGGPSCPSCPTCNDGIQNGQETGVDCGGPTCPACPTCNDGIQNGNETDIDCGGPTCPACSTCNDGIQNGNETGIDCGGNCPPCNSSPVFIGGYYFETGWDEWIDGGAHCFRYGGSISPEGTYSIRLRNTGLESSMTSPSYNLNGYQSVNVEFMFRTSGVEAGKSFVLQYFNGTTYSTVATFISGNHFVNNVNYTTNVTLTESFSANSKFRFENGGTDNSDFVFLDGIVIHAMNGSSLIENPISIIKSDKILEEYIADDEFKIYPNPTTHILNVEVADTPSKIRIINALGEEVMNFIVSNQIETIDISHLPSGVFIIVSENGSGVESKKLIKH